MLLDHLVGQPDPVHSVRPGLGLHHGGDQLQDRQRLASGGVAVGQRRQLSDPISQRADPEPAQSRRTGSTRVPDEPVCRKQLATTPRKLR